jgi:hypothetical protein
MAVGAVGGVVEVFKSGDPTITMTGSAAITAGQLVEMTGNRTVGPAGAGSVKTVGVALQDYDGVAATGAKLPVATGGVFLLKASGAISAGDALIAGAAGVVVTAGATPDARTVVGFALAAISSGQTGPCILRLS